ncbi:SUKH-4 family immunity protein [Micromonospora sp. U21]|uniref:SUKH-4 family immunity protein n=1 Tax=Micromonospora sp. U21 TaxID=2824899 RepID=UPI001B38D58E|nr:SUKH-4 family immunity protein [Micromonospora sp. U21]MBQ0905488.1 SUKH-4 family immunity protein [Micromonospora sp. U21]
MLVQVTVTESCNQVMEVSVLWRYEDLVGAFGAESVVRYSEADLAGLGLPPQAEQVLTEIGLPSSVGRDYMKLVAPSRFSVAETGQSFLRLYGSYSNDFALNLSTGEVWRVSNSHPAISQSFVNSDIASFAQCISRFTLFLRYLPETRSDEESVEWSRQLEEQVGAIDPRCLTEQDAFFANAVFEVRIGMM